MADDFLDGQTQRMKHPKPTLQRLPLRLMVHPHGRSFPPAIAAFFAERLMSERA